MPNVLAQKLLGWNSPGKPGSAQEAAYRAKNVRKVPYPHVDTLWVHKDVVLIFKALLIILDRHDAKVGQRVDDWGFNNRDIRGFPGVKSYHAWALAGDIDATENALGVRRTTFDIKSTRAMCKWLGLKWGYDYKGRPDPMHFEFGKSHVRARYISKRLTKVCPRTRALAKLAGLDVHTFLKRLNG